MKQYRNLVACLIALSAKSATANTQQLSLGQNNQVTDEQIANSVATLVAAGAIEVKDSKLVIKNPSALEELQSNGRLTYEDAVAGVVCF